jgi:hypothetical protein
MKVSELEGDALNYWVAKAEGYQLIDVPPDADGQNASRILAPPNLLASGYQFPPRGKLGHMLRQWSSRWEHGGPLIEKYKMYVCGAGGEGWEAHCDDRMNYGKGRTALEAICRAVVLAKFGDEVPGEPA